MITIVSGTNRSQALSLQIAYLYQKKIQEKGAEVQLIDLNELPPDFAFSALYENDGKNAAFNKFRTQMQNSEKYIFIIAEYNGSFPGVLKTFIDGLAYPNTFKEKKAALVGLSAGVQGGSLALSHFSDILNYLGTHTLALRVKLARLESFMKEGVIENKLYQDLIEQQIESFIKF